MKPFGMDLDVTSNRSSTISQVNLHMLKDFSAWENASYKTLGHFEHSYCLTVTAPSEAELYLLLIQHLTISYFPSPLFLWDSTAPKLWGVWGQHSDIQDLRLYVILMGCIFPAIITAFSWLSFNWMHMEGVNTRFLCLNFMEVSQFSSCVFSWNG